MQNSVLTRLAILEDANPIAQFNCAMAKETEQRELARDIVTAGVTGLLKNPALGFYVVAESEGDVVGSLMITSEWSDWRNGIFWWIQSVYVLPGYRRRGIYRSLYAFIKNRAARENSVCGFRLYVEKDNLSAQKAYESLGMQPTGYRMFEELA